MKTARDIGNKLSPDANQGMRMRAIEEWMGRPGAAGEGLSPLLGQAQGVARWGQPPHALAPMPCSALHGLLGAVLDELDHAVLVCTPQGEVTAYNRCARHQLDDHPQLQLQAQQLGTRASEPAGLWLALSQALKLAAQGRRSLVPLGEGEQRRYLACSPLGDSGHVLLLLGQARGYSPVAFEMFCKQHQLTHAERRILGGLVAGQRPAEMADAHGVALSTVRTQVAHIRAKLGADRIESLMAMAAGLPPLAALLGGTSTH